MALAPCFLGSRFRILSGLVLILYVPLILSAKAAYFFIRCDYLNRRHGFIEPIRQSLQPTHEAFYLVSQRPPDWRRKPRQLRREFLHLLCPGFSERGDRAGAVASQERDLLPQHPETRRVGTDLGCCGLDAVLRRNEIGLTRQVVEGVTEEVHIHRWNAASGRTSRMAMRRPA